METRVDEIAERIYRRATFLPKLGPSGFTFNQFLVDADEPLLFHCGQRALFPEIPPRRPGSWTFAVSDGSRSAISRPMGLLYEEVTGTLFTSDLFTHVGDPPPLSSGDILSPAMVAEKQFGFTPVTAATGATVRRLAALRPRTLAVMHGSSFSGDAPAVLESLAGFYDGLLQKAATPRAG